MLEYLTSMIGFIIPYVKLFITMSFLWAAICNYTSYKVKVKYGNPIETSDVRDLASAIVMLISVIVILYVI